MHSQRSLLTIGRLATVETALKAAMNKACRSSHLSREEIVDRINELAQAAGIQPTGGNAKQLNFNTFEKWLAPAALDQFPSIRGIVLFCEAVQDIQPLSVLAEVLGGRVINEEETRRLERAEIDDEIKRLRKRKKLLEAK